MKKGKIRKRIENIVMKKILIAAIATFCNGIWCCRSWKSTASPRKRATLINRLCGSLLILAALRIVSIADFF
nr:hypothetical protein [Endozoicomonas sp.]